MPSKLITSTKGIDYYVFLDNENFTTTFYASGSNSVTCCDYHPMCKGSFQINILNNIGSFSWEVTHKEKVLIKRFAEINKLLGNLLNSDLSNMMTTQSIITFEYALSYGFYDCRTRSFESHLTNRDRSYVYLIENYSEWMKDLASKDLKFLDRPLSVLALLGAHDAGTLEISNFKLLLKNEDFSNKLHSRLKEPLVCESIDFFDIADYLERIVINLVCTQKNDIYTMLNIGIRYFDFRPGHSYGALKDITEFKNKIFHQHVFVPG